MRRLAFAVALAVGGGREQIREVIGTPPYGLAAVRFPCRALAARAGRTPLGGEREVALACWLGARLVTAFLPPFPLAPALRTSRAAAARVWLAGLTLPAATRTALSRLVDASGGDSPPAAAAAVRRVVGAASAQLDAASLAELGRIADALERLA